MSLLEPTESQLRQTGSLKWTGVTASDGKPTLGAWVAEMDFGTAPEVAERIKRAIDEGLLGYLPPWLSTATAESLVRFQERRFGWEIRPQWVRVANSVLGALEATINRLTRPGSPIIVPEPAYMPFLTIPGKLDRQVISVKALHTENPGGRAGIGGREAWSLDLEGIKAGLEAGAGLVILCNPWNPTGRFLRTPELRALHDLVTQYDALVFSDEIHSPLTLGDPSRFTSYASLGPTYAAHAITATAASKAWNIAGLAAAQVVLPDAALRERWDRDAAAHAHGATPLGLLGATVAYDLDDSWLDEALAYISGNLDLLDEAIRTTEIDYTRPEATYLTWWGWGAYNLLKPPSELLRDGPHVAVNAGSTLGKDYVKWTRVNAAMVRPEWERTVEAAVGLVSRGCSLHAGKW